MKLKRSTRQRSRGVSLIEALVALGVMGVGILGVVGVQATLRMNADVAKQRSEALRLAQSEIERLRAFTSLSDEQLRFAAPASLGGNQPGSSAIFTRVNTVVDLAPPLVGDAAKAGQAMTLGKALKVTVQWMNRRGSTESVQLATQIARIAPELSATLAVPMPGGAVNSPGGRTVGIPKDAKLLDVSRSVFIPPGASAGVVWVFNNVTGVATVCSTTAGSYATLNAENVTCSPGAESQLLVSGFIRYALADTQPTAADAANPPSTPSQVRTPIVSIDPESDKGLINPWVIPDKGTSIKCEVDHVNTAPAYTAYFCLVPVAVVITGAAPTWSGSIEMQPKGQFQTQASYAAKKVRTCRYVETPASYSLVSQPQQNQNFLIIRSGVGTGGDGTAFSCPEGTTQHGS